MNWCRIAETMFGVALGIFAHDIVLAVVRLVMS